MSNITELNWKEYRSPIAPPVVPNGLYIRKDGSQIGEFSSGPRDTFVWLMVDGRVTQGIEKYEFLNNFEFLDKQ